MVGSASELVLVADKQVVDIALAEWEGRGKDCSFEGVVGMLVVEAGIVAAVVVVGGSMVPDIARLEEVDFGMDLVLDRLAGSLGSLEVAEARHIEGDIGLEDSCIDSL